MSIPKVLIADDDPNVCEIIRLFFSENNFEVIEASNGHEALSLFESTNPDIILLDIMMPGMDGYEVCREIRKKADIPIIMLSAKDEEFDRILGLEIGADDYVTKPFSPREIIARIKAIFRRTTVKNSTELEHNEEIYQFKPFKIDVKKREVIVDGTPLFFRPKEFDLLLYLIRHSNAVLTRDQLLEHVWGFDFEGDIRTVDVHVKRIRNEFAKHQIDCIHTVWGVGYQFLLKERDDSPSL
ncbi:response regulator transcription factor [Halalkalibacter urbisdiaboli]|uniref:response regulator transcription factor n=1 Tax=Halalkalibacter urbisdiaboli TaxID=1960589 RepID=UPI000B43D013|nr:response regulator transcription factor [Halalkalibacter urbisdiaboli]